MKYLKRNGDEGGEDDPLTSKIIGIAIEIHRFVGPGYPESHYHRAMEIDLAEAGISFVSQAPLAVHYKGKILGTFAVDLLVEKKLIVELKALEDLPLISEIQVVQYLKASKIDIGLILNFGASRLQIKRKFRGTRKVDDDLRLYES